MLQAKTRTSHGLTALRLCMLLPLTGILSACGGADGDAEAQAIGIQDVAIAYIKRPTPRAQNGDLIRNDLRQPAAFTAGGDVYLQPRASATAPVRNITRAITGGNGDVKGLNVSYDGKRLVFSLRLADPDPNDNIVPSWNLYEYNMDDNSLRALLPVSIQENGDDISPHYLPDDRIIFASTRQISGKGIRINEGRNGTFVATDENRRNAAFALHVLDKDGSIRQVSFNPSHDLDPVVLDNGRVLFSRWNNMGSRSNVSLYTMNPDGSDVQLYYGAHSYRTGQNNNTNVHFTHPRQMQDGRILAILRPFVTNFGGGDIVFIDGKRYADNTQPIWEQQGNLAGTAQTLFKSSNATTNGLSLQGRYNAVFPMQDGSNRYLMSWTQCQILETPGDPNSRIIPCTLASSSQLNDPNVTEAPPSYGIFLVDADRNTQIPLIRPQADSIISEIVMAYNQKLPPVIFDKVPGVSADINNGFAQEGVGVLHIRSVYDFDNNFSAYGYSLPTMDNDGQPITIDTPEEIANPKNTTADQRPARFVRIIKQVDLPDRSVKRIAGTAFGRSAQQGMREIIGYAPVEPDGSVKIKVPANVPLTLAILDKDGIRISPRHQSWFQVKPGETLECIGCHVHDTANLDNNKPHGRPDSASSFNQGAATTGIGFPYSVASLWAQIGETMAETRARHSCLPSNPSPCAAMKPSTDLVYDDVWTDQVAANRSADNSFRIDYSNAPVSPLSSGASTANACSNGYNTTISSFTYCRVVINYTQHIQPIWEKARTPNSCVSCHTATNLAHLNAAQLELTSNPSDQNPDHLTSYRELLFNDNGQDASGNDIMITRTIQPPIDANNDGIPDTETVPDPAATRRPSMSTAGARNSLFMEMMTGRDLNNDGTTPTDTQGHSTMLTASELKLIAEWLDIGAQYFNDPFDSAVPTN